MAFKINRENLPNSPFQYIDGQAYPDYMIEYREHWSSKLRETLRPFFIYGEGVNKDLGFYYEVERFDLTCTPINYEEEEIKTIWEEKVHWFYDRYKVEPVRRKYCCMLNLTYNLDLIFKIRPGGYTDYYSNKICTALYENGFKFREYPIQWEKDDNNGKCYTQRINIDCSMEISEELAQELSDEFKRLYDY